MGESKYRTTPNKKVVQDIMKTLSKDSLPISLPFVRDRLDELGEDDLADEGENNAYVAKVREFAATENAEVVVVCAQIEAEIAELDTEEEKKESENGRDSKDSGRRIRRRKRFKRFRKKNQTTEEIQKIQKEESDERNSGRIRRRKRFRKF